MANNPGGISRLVPGRGGATITPNDSTVFDQPYRALYCGSKGDIKVDLANGDTVTFENVQTGSWLPIEVTKVYSTGTTSTSIVGVF